MSILAIILVNILTFGITWVIMSCLWAASEADKKEEEDERTDNDD